MDERSLTATERRVVEALAKGRRAECDGGSLRGWFLRDLAIEVNPAWRVQPTGIQIYNARIEGPLDLEGCTVARPLLFFLCRFGHERMTVEPIQLRDARLRRLGLYECTVVGGINADRAEVEGSIFMRGATVTGGLRLRGARIGGSLTMEDARFSGSGSDMALVLAGSEIGGPWIMRGARVEGQVFAPAARIAGALLMEEAEIDGGAAGKAMSLDGIWIDGPWVARGARVRGSIVMRAPEIKGAWLNEAVFDAGPAREPAINADGARIEADWLAPDAMINGGLRLSNARVDGELSLHRTTLEGRKDVAALDVSGVRVRQNLVLRGTRLHGGLAMGGARIGRDIDASGMRKTGARTSVLADVIRVGGNWLMRGARLEGSLRFPGAAIEGQLALTDCAIAGGDLAIRADGARIRGGWFMGRAEIHGLVRLPACSIGNQLRFRASRIRVDHGPAVFASGTTVKRDILMNEGFRAEGGLVLDQVKVSGTIDFQASQIVSSALARAGAHVGDAEVAELTRRHDETAISLVDARADRLRMPDGASHRPRGIVDLSRAHVGSLEDYASAWPPPARKGAPFPEGRGRSEDGRDIDHLVLDGFSYEHLENPAGMGAEDRRHPYTVRRAAEARIAWLNGQARADLDDHFKPQAWVHLGRRLAAQGYHEDARRIAIARRRRHRQSRTIRRRVRMQSQLLDLFALFGYNPWRTVAWIVLFIGLFAGLWSWAATGCREAGCADETVFIRAEYGRFSPDAVRLAKSYPAFSPLAYSFDLFIPVIDFGYQTLWRPNVRYGPITEIAIPAPGPWLARLAGEGAQRGEGSAPLVRITLTRGGILYVLAIVEMILGLVLTSLAVTAFTGLLRRDD